MSAMCKCVQVNHHGVVRIWAFCKMGECDFDPATNI